MKDKNKLREEDKDKQFREEIGSRLREFRRFLNQTQDELAQNTGYTRAGMSFIESGLQNPPLYFLVSLNLKYDLSINWLLTGKGEITTRKGKKIAVDEYFSGLNQEDKELADTLKACRKFFTSANKNEKDAVLNLIKTLSAPYQK